MAAMSTTPPADHSGVHPFGFDDEEAEVPATDEVLATDETLAEPGFIDDDRIAPVDGLLPAWNHSTEDDYADFEHEAARIEALFKDPMFAEMAAGRNELRPPRSTEARGSVGRAVALGFANVFDPDRVKDDVMVIAERGDGDSDLPETTIDPDDPKHTKVIFRRKKKR
jgi:hypothetical protein